MAWTYCITDRRTCDVPILQQVQRAVRAGIDYLQIREKDLPTRELLSLALKAREITKGYATQILVNDRLDIALAANLRGIHLSQTSPPPDVIRPRVSRKKFLIGVSTHNVEEVRRAIQNGADYVIFGPVFATPSKLRFGPPRGLSALRETVRYSNRPVLALGGIDQGNFSECLAQGAAGIAAIRLFQQPNPNLQEVVRAISSHRPKIFHMIG